MKTIIFIGTHKSGSSYEALEAAESMHYLAVVLTNRKSFIQKRSEFPHAHLMEYCDIGNIDKTKSVIEHLQNRGLEICAIVSFIEPYCYHASVLAQHFGLKHFTSDAILRMLDKIESRKLLSGTPYTPRFCVADENICIKLPLILKATKSAGSKDVHRVETHDQYREALNELHQKYPGEPVLAEEYLDGQQFLIETVTQNSKVEIIAVIKQEITFTGRFIVTGYTMMHERDESLEKAVEFIINAHGLIDGTCHLEMRQCGNQWKLVEINSRISGGAINTFIETALGLNLVQETLKVALGITPDFKKPARRETFLQYVIVPKSGILLKVTGKGMAQECPGVEHVYIRTKKGCLIIPPLSMSDRYAYVIATGATAAEAKENARNSAAQIKFHLCPICDCELQRIIEKNQKHIENFDALFDNCVMC